MQNLHVFRGFLFRYLVPRPFRAKISLRLEKGDYVVKTAENEEELEEVLRLRYAVFHREYMNKRLGFGLDTEALDPIADHLMIVEKKSGRVVGTYRLISSSHSNVFYSQSEFALDAFLACPGVKLELSRACVHRDFRTGSVMNLLWRGLVQYLREVKADYLFGCSSVKTIDATEAALLCGHLDDKGVVGDDFVVTPLGRFRMDLAAARLKVPAGAGETAKALIPPLLSSYLRAGAKVYGEPALDRAFKCIDFFTVLDLRELNASYERKYAAC